MTDIILRPDNKGRIALGEFAKGVSSFKVTKEENGCLTLQPYIEVPFSEKWIFENKEMLDKVIQQLNKEDNKLENK